MKQKPRSQRQLKVGEEIRRFIAELLMRGDLYAPGHESCSITVSEARISPDFSNATVFVMPLGGKNTDEVLKYLEVITPQIRQLMSKQLTLRTIPRFKFMIDDTFDRAQKINEALKNSPNPAED